MTQILYSEWINLDFHCLKVLEYERLTEQAKFALNQHKRDEAILINASRDALGYKPPAAEYTTKLLLKRAEALEVKLLERYQTVLVASRDVVRSKVGIDHAVVCMARIQKLNELKGPMEQFCGLSKVELDNFSDLLQITWDKLRVISVEDDFLGQGNFGRVYRMLWQRSSSAAVAHVPVAVKVMNRSMSASNNKDYDKEKTRAFKEAERIVEVSKRGGQAMADLIVQVYGFVEGPLPDSLTALFKLRKGEEAFGVVMRLEGGGSLDNLLHPPPDVTTHITLPESVRLLSRVIESLAVLHSYGVVHGDLKPENVLLNDKQPPDPRIGDFGLSELRENALQTLQQSTVQKTSKAKGTPVYMAPEMLYENHGLLAKATRSTDMYAFALLAYEVLSRCRPFDGLGLGALTMKVCSGERPPLDKLPSDTPQALKDMIERCWDSDRNKRLSAVECYAIVSHVHSVFEKKSFDVFFSHRWAMKHFLSHLYNLLTRLGYRVWYDQVDMGHNISLSMLDGIKNSAVVLACVDEAYQSRLNCMYELKNTRDMSKPLITVLTQSNVSVWGSIELKSICQVGTATIIDLASLATKDGWTRPDGAPDDWKVSDALLDELKMEAEPIIRLLEAKGCKPSMSAQLGGTTVNVP